MSRRDWQRYGEHGDQGIDAGLEAEPQGIEGNRRRGEDVPGPGIGEAGAIKRWLLPFPRLAEPKGRLGPRGAAAPPGGPAHAEGTAAQSCTDLRGFLVLGRVYDILGLSLADQP